MAYLIAGTVMTLSVAEPEGHSAIASLFKCDILYLWLVAWSLCRTSCVAYALGYT